MAQPQGKRYEIDMSSMGVDAEEKFYEPPIRHAYTTQVERIATWKSYRPDRTDFKRATEYRIAVQQHYTQYPMPYGMDVLARDYAHVGKKKLCTFGGPGDGPMQLQEPTGLTITDRESILVADTLNHRIVEWMVQRRQGNMVKKFGSKGKSTGEFRNPQAVAIHPRNGDIAVTDSVNSRIQLFHPDGSFKTTFGSAGKSNGDLRSPSGLCFTETNDLIVCDEGNHRVQVFNDTGSFKFAFGKRGNREGEFQFPCAVAVHHESSIIAVCDRGNHRIQLFAYDGVFLKTLGGKGDAPTKFNEPSGVTFNTYGDLLVSDTKNKRVQIFWPSGGFCCMFPTQKEIARDGANGDGWFDAPGAVAFDDRLLLVADSKTCTVSVLRPAQQVACGTFLAYLPQEFVHDVFRMLHYNDANKNENENENGNGNGNAGSNSNDQKTKKTQQTNKRKARKPRANGGICAVNRFFLSTCRSMRLAWDFAPLDPGVKTSSKVVLGRKVAVQATELEFVKELWEKWGVGTDRELKILEKGVMRFDQGFRSAMSALYGAKYWYTYQNLLGVCFEFYAHKYSMRFSRDNPLGSVIGQKEFFLILTFDKEVQLGLKTWHDHPATTGRYAKLPLLGQKMSAFDFRETVIFHQQRLLVPRCDKPLRGDPGILLQAGRGGYHLMPPESEGAFEMMKKQTEELKEKQALALPDASDRM